MSCAESTMEALLARVRKLEDTLEIQKLQSQYAHYLFTQQFERIFSDCFAQDLASV
jgi:hypothetical protein